MRPEGLDSLGRSVLSGCACSVNSIVGTGPESSCPQVTQKLLRSAGTPCTAAREWGEEFQPFCPMVALPKTVPFLAPTPKLQISPHDTTGVSRMTERDLLPPTTLLFSQSQAETLPNAATTVTPAGVRAGDSRHRTQKSRNTPRLLHSLKITN